MGESGRLQLTHKECDYVVVPVVSRETLQLQRLAAIESAIEDIVESGGKVSI